LFFFKIYLLNHRFRQHQQIIWKGQGGIQDRTIYEDSVFAKMLRDDGLMDERDYRTYVNLFKNMSNFMKHNNMIVHLDVSPEQSMERIKSRYVFDEFLFFSTRWWWFFWNHHPDHTLFLPMRN